MTEGQTSAYLFSPDHVRARLSSLPALKAELSDPDKEGSPSHAFPRARKSPRQIFRVLANDHFPHLAELLERIDRVISQGFLLPTLVRTSGGSNFESALAELRTAEQLLATGWLVEELEPTRGRESVPEFLVTKKGHAAVVEVYCPRTREGFDQLMDGLMHQVKNLDRALDYRFEINVEQLHRFGDDGRLLHVSPYELARALDNETRQRLETTLMSQINAQLDAGKQTCSATVEAGNLNIRCTIELDNVSESKAELPDRWGPISQPGFSGYAPEAILDRVVRGRVRRKALKRQAPNSAFALESVLVIDMSCSDLADYPEQPAYVEDFKASLQRHLSDNPGGYNAIIFCDRNNGSGLRGQFLVSQVSPSSTVREIATALDLTV